MVDPARVTRRAIAGWGMGHVALGDGRGWLLLCLEIAWIATLAVGLSLMATDQWLVVFGLLAGFLGTWVGQAVLAHRKASRLSGSDHGALQLAAVMPVGMLVLTAFWSAGGATSSRAPHHPTPAMSRSWCSWCARHRPPRAS